LTRSGIGVPDLSLGFRGLYASLHEGIVLFRANYTVLEEHPTNATNELFSSIVNPRRAQDGNNFPSERGLSALDIRHKLAISWVYDFPNISTEHGYLKALAHGWELVDRHRLDHWGSL